MGRNEEARKCACINRSGHRVDATREVHFSELPFGREINSQNSPCQGSDSKWVQQDEVFEQKKVCGLERAQRCDKWACHRQCWWAQVGPHCSRKTFARISEARRLRPDPKHQRLSVRWVWLRPDWTWSPVSFEQTYSETIYRPVPAIQKRNRQFIQQLSKISRIYQKSQERRYVHRGLKLRDEKPWRLTQ